MRLVTSKRLHCIFSLSKEVISTKSKKEKICAFQKLTFYQKSRCMESHIIRRFVCSTLNVLDKGQSVHHVTWNGPLSRFYAGVDGLKQIFPSVLKWG